MFDLNWLDMIREYVNVCNGVTTFTSKSPANDKKMYECYEFIGKYDLPFAYYIIELYDIKNGIFPRFLYKKNDY